MGDGGQWTAGVLWVVLAAALADSWTAYQEQPCCRPVSHHRVRHHRARQSDCTVPDDKLSTIQKQWRPPRDILSKRDEVALLVDLIQSNPIIISKETNAATNKIKDETWNSLTSTYNAKSGSVPRTREQLKLKWDNLKKAARKRAQQIRMNILKTGGGKPDFIPPDEILEKVSEILGPTCTGFTVPFGDDGVGVSEIQEYLDTASDNIEGIPIDIEILNTSTKDKEVEVCKESHSAATTKSFFGCTRSKQVLKRDHIREFSCGTLFYRALYMNEERNTLYVGAMDRVFKLNMSDISQSHCERDALLLEASNVARCVSKGKSEPFECRNHIRVLEPLGDGERLYVCGTNAHSPKDWVIYLNLTHLPRHEYVPGVGLGVAKCPYDPADNSTAVWVTEGNPGDLPALYAGTNAEFTKADPVIFRNDLFDFRTGQKKFNFKRTLKYDSKWLDKTNFVGSFDVGEYVLFFFRETAVEFMNCGKAVYSRVARVCKQDTGGKHILSQNWVTYLKARLNCSIPGEFPFYFDEIQSVYQMPGDTSRFYAAFTTGASDGLVGSAICTYSMDDIQEAFAGRFKEQASSSSAWLPVLRARVPSPRPGTCVNNTEELPDNVLNFIRSHPLMDSAVRHEGDTPAFYKRDLVLTTLVVDKQFVDMLGDDITYTIFYAGTSAGEVYKIVQWAGGGSRVADVWVAAGDEPVRALALSRQTHALYLATDHRLRQLPLRACSHRYDSCVRCVLDPYCGWDKEIGSCRPYTPGLLHDATNSTPSICEASAPLKSIRANYGQSVHLAAFGRTPEALKEQHVVWYHHSREKGRYKINYNWDRVLQTSERGLVLLSVTDFDRGRYECYFGPTLIVSYNLDIDMQRCTQPNKSQEYKQVYSDWCHEFEKYKSAMKAWESRQMQCSKSMNASSQQNSMGNEIVTSLR